VRGSTLLCSAGRFARCLRYFGSSTDWYSSVAARLRSYAPLRDHLTAFGYECKVPSNQTAPFFFATPVGPRTKILPVFSRPRGRLNHCLILRRVDVRKSPLLRVSPNGATQFGIPAVKLRKRGYRRFVSTFIIVELTEILFRVLRPISGRPHWNGCATSL